MTSRAVALLVAAAAACAGAPPPPTRPVPDPPSPSPPRVVPAAPAAPTGMAAAMVAEHDRYRAQHCAPPLTWSPELARVAQRWADTLRDRGCAFAHSGGEYGENIAEGTSGTLDPAAVVAMWYREVSAYDFQHGGFSMKTGHFTQVVWRSTTRVGCGMSTCGGRGGMDIWVCNYDPPGNFEGEYRENVRPKGCR